MLAGHLKQIQERLLALEELVLERVATAGAQTAHQEPGPGTPPTSSVSLVPDDPSAIAAARGSPRVAAQGGEESARSWSGSGTRRTSCTFHSEQRAVERTEEPEPEACVLRDSAVKDKRVDLDFAESQISGENAITLEDQER